MDVDMDAGGERESERGEERSKDTYFGQRRWAVSWMGDSRMSVFDKNRCECASAHQPEGQKGGDGCGE